MQHLVTIQSFAHDGRPVSIAFTPAFGVAPETAAVRVLQAAGVRRDDGEWAVVTLGGAHVATIETW